MPGRPRALNEVKRREVCALVSAGCGLDGAAQYVGCNVVTIRREAMRNPEFYEQLRSAELGAQLSPLQALRKAAGSHWRAAAWLLERTQPKRFARRNPHRFTDEHVSKLLFDLVDSLLEEVDDPGIKDRLYHRLHQLAASLDLEVRAIDAPRPDVHSRRRETLERRAERQPPGLSQSPVTRVGHDTAITNGTAAQRHSQPNDAIDDKIPTHFARHAPRPNQESPTTSLAASDKTRE
jgi:hypothetical protein